MILKVFTVFDVKANAHLQPFFSTTAGQAIRMFESSVNAPDHQFAKYPTDFTLFEVGEYDDSNGSFNNHKAIIDLGNALKYKTLASEKMPLFDKGN